MYFYFAGSRHCCFNRRGDNSSSNNSSASISNTIPHHHNHRVRKDPSICEMFLCNSNCLLNFINYKIYLTLFRLQNTGHQLKQEYSHMATQNTRSDYYCHDCNINFDHVNAFLEHVSHGHPDQVPSYLMLRSDGKVL